jgi:hypothetical protein
MSATRRRGTKRPTASARPERLRTECAWWALALQALISRGLRLDVGSLL